MARVGGLLLLAVVGVACAGTPRTATAPTARNPADAVVEGVENFYETRNRLTVRFRQRNVNKTFGLPTVNDGTFYFHRPDRMRWDYFSKRDKNVISRSQVSNGRIIWAVAANGKWYYQQDLAKSTLPVAVSFLAGKGELTRKFSARLLTASKHGGASDKVLELTPKNPSARFKTLVLVVDPSTFQVKKSIVTTATGDINELSFSAATPALSVKTPAARVTHRQLTQREKLRRWCEELSRKPPRPGGVSMWCGSEIDRATCCVD